MRWRPVTDGNTTYVHLFNELIRAVIRQLRGHPFPLPFPLTTPQQSKCLALIDGLLDTNRSEEDNVTALQNFLWEIISTPTFTPWSNLFQVFFAILSLRVDGTYACAADISPDLAKFKYLIHATCMAEALSKPVDQQGR